MNPQDDKTAGSSGNTPGPADLSDRETGLPLLRSWRAVYLFVFGCFVLWVVLLVTLTVIYS
ncbi:MAG: hypothetical protein WAO02_10685 [Verrucomicrobiia bacterium]